MIGVREDSPIERDRVMEHLHERGVPTRRGVMASHQERPYRNPELYLPNTQRAFVRNLQLPMHPGITASQQAQVVDALDAITRETTNT